MQLEKLQQSMFMWFSTRGTCVLTAKVNRHILIAASLILGWRVLCRQHPWFTLHLPRYLAVMQADTIATAAQVGSRVRL